MGLGNSYLLSPFVQEGLRTLDVNTEASPVYAGFFNNAGPFDP